MHVVKCEIRARGAQICPWGVCKQVDLKDNVRMSGYLTKCRCMHVKQVQKWIKLKEQEACEGSCGTATVGAKSGKLMQHLRKEIYNLKQHFYKLKQVKTPVFIQKNE